MITNATTARVENGSGTARVAKTTVNAHQSTAATIIKIIKSTNLPIYSPPNKPNN